MIIIAGRDNSTLVFRRVALEILLPFYIQSVCYYGVLNSFLVGRSVNRGSRTNP